jgi:hypothetical protein
MTRWRCKECKIEIDNGEFTHPENILKEWVHNPTPCPVCESTEGYDNADWESQIIIPEPNYPSLDGGKNETDV